MKTLDWAIVGSIITLIVAVSVYASRYSKGVVDFLSGGRLAGRYLLAVAKGEIGAGAVVFVAMFEVIRLSGFTLTWWHWCQAPVLLLITTVGFVVYRFRETKALTIAQFFEIRYSRSFRVFTGFLGFFAGIVNFGIIPAVGSRFLVYFLGLPQTIQIGEIAVATYIPLMAALLICTLLLLLPGGLISLMVTNCIEGMISQILYVILIFSLMSMFSWDQIEYALTHISSLGSIVERSQGESLINPFDSMGLKDFNIWYVIMGTIVLVYGTMAWQNQSAYNSAAITAHESRMGGILGRWREMGKGPVVILLGVCAMTYLIHPDFAQESQVVQQEVSKIADPKVQSQMTIPVAVVHMLPVGLKGVLCVILLMGVLGGDGGHLHSWGSLFIQDVLLPLKKKKLTPEQHVRWLRLGMIGVAVFAFIFGTFFQQTEYIMMWFAVTQALYVGGAGAAIIGGLYWKKGTTQGAWASIILGSGLSTGGIVARQIFKEDFPLNGIQISFAATMIAILVYVIVSLLTCKKDHDMDQLLHRDPSTTIKVVEKKVFTWRSLMGVDRNFSKSDRWITISLTLWSWLWFCVFVLGGFWNWISPWSPKVWSNFWYVSAIVIPVVLCVLGAIWFTWGGIIDMRTYFKLLKEKVEDVNDNGVVNKDCSLTQLNPEKLKEVKNESCT